MRLQQRDQKLLALLSRYGVLSTSQIAKLCFGNIALTTALRRLRLLEEAKHIIRYEGLKNHMNAWGLTKIGARTIEGSEPFRYSNRNTLTHEVALSQIRIHLNAMGLGEDWVSEIEMRRNLNFEPGTGFRSLSLIPDGLFTARCQGEMGAVAVECELTPKGHARYVKLFPEYMRKDSISWVWYLVGSSGIGNLVYKIWQKTPKRPRSPKLIISVLPPDETLSIKTQLWDCSGKKHELSDFFGIQIQPQTTAQQVSRNTAIQLSTLTETNLQLNQPLSSTLS